MYSDCKALWNALEGDIWINTAQQLGSLYRQALLYDNALTRNSLVTSSSPTGKQQFLISTNVFRELKKNPKQICSRKFKTLIINLK